MQRMRERSLILFACHPTHVGLPQSSGPHGCSPPFVWGFSRVEGEGRMHIYTEPIVWKICYPRPINEARIGLNVSIIVPASKHTTP